jgi:hypothetical protein
MASTVNKDFKIKNGLIVEGSSATVGGSDVLTKKQADIDYIVSLAGGGADSANVANKVVKRDASGNFAAGTITAALTGNASTASTLATPRAIALSGDVSGTVNFDGSAGVTITTTLNTAFATDAEVATAKSQAIASAATDATTKADAAKTGAEATAAAALSSHESDTTNIHGIADTALLATKSYADGKASDAQTAATSAAATDATTKVAAEATARATAVTAAISTAATDATTKVAAEATARATAVTNAISTAAADATSKVAAEATARDTAIGTAISTEVTNRNSAISSAISTEVTNRNSAISTAVAAVVDSAPAMLDTLNELAAALGNNPNVITNLTTTIGTKLPLAGGTLTGALVLSGAPTADLQATTKGYVDTANTNQSTTLTTAIATAKSEAISTASSDATSKANAAQTAATSAAATDATTKVAAEAALRVSGDAASVSTAAADATTKADAAKAFATAADTTLRTAVTTDIATAKSEAIATAATDASTKRDAAKTYADGLIATEVTNRNSAITAATGALSTSTIPEGTNKYFTDARAVAAVSGAITSAVDAINTDAIEEGTSNLYFTNARALTAVGGSVTTAIANGSSTASPTYLAVKLGTLAKEFAATVNVPTASTATAYSWPIADFRSAKVLVKTKNGTHTEISELLLTLDTSNNIAITEYALVGTNGTLATVTADVNGTDARIRVTTINASSDVYVVGTLIA